MISNKRIFVIIGILLIQEGLSQQPNCVNYQDGYISPDLQNPNHFYLCHLRIPVPMACSTGLVFCADGGMNVCVLNCPSLNPNWNGNNMPPNSWVPPAVTSAPNQAWPTAATARPYEGWLTAPTIGRDEELPTAPTPRPQAAPIQGMPTAPAIPPAASPNVVPTAAPNVMPTAAPVAPQSVILECRNQSHGTIVPIPENCSGYATCVNGKPVVGSCLNNRAFDPSNGVCSENIC